MPQFDRVHPGARAKVDDQRARRQPGGEARKPSRDSRPIPPRFSMKRNAIASVRLHASEASGVVGHRLPLDAVPNAGGPEGRRATAAEGIDLRREAEGRSAEAEDDRGQPPRRKAGLVAAEGIEPTRGVTPGRF